MLSCGFGWLKRAKPRLFFGLPASPKPTPPIYCAPRCPPPDGLIAGAEDIPALQALKQGHDQEQECILFVALSRARDRLHLSASSVQPNGKKRNRSAYLDRIAAKIDERPAPPATPGRPAPRSAVEIAWTELPSLTDHQLSQYEDCPRRFFYTHVLRLAGRRTETPFTRMHASLQSVLDWLSAMFPATVPDAAAAEAQLEAAWHQHGPVDHPFATDYRRIAGDLLGYLLAARMSGTLLEPRPLTLKLGQSRVTAVPNHVVRKPDGAVSVRKVKTGRLTSDEFDGLDYTVLLLAAKDAYGAHTIVEAVHLTSATTTPAEISARSLGNRKTKAEEALDAIRNGAFARKPDQRRCARCPHFFHCGALPEGTIAAKI